MGCPMFGHTYAEVQKCNGHMYVTELFIQIMSSHMYLMQSYKAS